MADAVYDRLVPEQIAITIDRLHRRVGERFPDSGLHQLIGDLAFSSRQTMQDAAWLERPLWLLRVAVAALFLGVPVGAYILAEEVELGFSIASGPELIQTTEAALGTLVFLGAGIAFVVTLEARIKRNRVLPALHDLRSMAHIIDMHQLTKDPERMRAPATASSPTRVLTDGQLARYYDYCSEALSLISKVAAVHGERVTDPVVLRAVDDLETLCTGMARKIWQKVMLLANGSGR